MPNPVIWTNEGVYRALNAMGSGTPFGTSGWRFVIYTNNYTPLVTSVLTDFTNSGNSTYSDYQSMGWTAGAGSGGVSDYAFASHTWNFAANSLGETMYGWHFDIYDGSLWKVAAAKLLDTPYPIPAGGGSYIFNATISARRLP
jgi:hypothetical protein